MGLIPRTLGIDFQANAGIVPRYAAVRPLTRVSAGKHGIRRTAALPWFYRYHSFLTWTNSADAAGFIRHETINARFMGLLERFEDRDRCGDFFCDYPGLPPLEALK